MLDFVNLQELAKGAMLAFANLLICQRERCRIVPIYKNLPKERRAQSCQARRSCQGSAAGFSQSIDLAKGAIVDSVNSQELAKGAPSSILSS